MAKCADKYEEREDMCEKSGCEKILPKLYGIYNQSSEINWESLRKFELKCTHGCGFNIICDDKDKLDKVNASKKLDKWLKIRLDKYQGELHMQK